jgi:hypothetical protein
MLGTCASRRAQPAIRRRKTGLGLSDFERSDRAPKRALNSTSCYSRSRLVVLAPRERSGWRPEVCSSGLHLPVFEGSAAMPGRKLARRWDPRFGVSRQMLEVESTYVAREKEDYLLLSVDDLQGRLASLRSAWGASDAVLEHAFGELPERDRLALSCLVVRDLYFVLELHCTHLGRPTGSSPTESRSPPPHMPNTSESKTVPFNEWLFGESDED